MQGYPSFMPVRPNEGCRWSWGRQAPLPANASPMDQINYKIKRTERTLSWYYGKLRRTSRCFMVIGSLGCLSAIYHYFTAKSDAIAMIKGTSPEETRHAPFMKREEFDIFDSLRNSAMLSMFLFTLFCGLGMMGRMATWWKKSAFQKRMIRKSVFGLICMLVLCVCIGIQKHQISSVVRKT